MRRVDDYEVSEDADQSGKPMRLRYAGRCRGCGAHLAAGVRAVFFRASREVACVACTGSTSDGEATTGAPASPPDCAPAVDAGVAGASARREHERRVARREQRVRDAHPRLGALILAVTDDPQSTRAWERGAFGEEVVGRRLDTLADRRVRTLHDRRVPGSRANIDHIAVAPSGVWVIDAKRYTGRPHLRAEGGLVRPRTETLLVGSRNCDKLVTGVLRQIAVVNDVLTGCPIAAAVPVHAVLCFVDADWPLFGGAITTRTVRVMWPSKLAEHLTADGPVSDQAADRIYRHLAGRLPCA